MAVKKLARPAALLLMAALLVSAFFSIGAGAGTFKDVSDNSPYAPAIELLASIKIVTGDENGFRPADLIKRSEFCKIIYVIYNGTADASAYTGETKFSDVSAQAWYSGYINWASQKGIVNGTEAGLFEPDAAVTIEQIIKMFVVAGIGTVENAIWPTTYLEKSNELNLGAGVIYAATNVSATREQVAQFSCNAVFTNSVLLGTSPNTKFFNSKRPAVPITEKKILLATWNHNFKNVKGNDGKAQITDKNQIVLADCITDDFAGLMGSYKAYEYAGKSGIDAYIGLPVTVTYSDSSRKTVTSVSPAYYSLKVVSAGRITESGGRYYADGEELLLGDRFSAESQISQAATKEYRKGRDGGFSLASKDDELLYLCDTDGDRKIDYGYTRIIYNGMMVVSATGNRVALTNPVGSYTWGDVSSAPVKFRSDDRLMPGDYVDGYMTCDENGETVMVLSKAATVTGKITSVSIASETAGGVSIDDVSYTLSGSVRSDNPAEAENGRALLASATSGDTFTLILDTAGFVVKAIKY